MSLKESSLPSSSYGWGASSSPPQRVERALIPEEAMSEQAEQWKGRAGSAINALMAGRALSAGKGLGSALSAGMGFSMPAALLAKAHPRQLARQVEADQALLGSSRALDVYEGLPSLNVGPGFRTKASKSDTMTESVDVGELLDNELGVLEFIVKVADSVRARDVGNVEFRLSDSFQKNSSAGPVKISSLLDSAAVVGVRYRQDREKISGALLDALKKGAKKTFKIHSASSQPPVEELGLFPSILRAAPKPLQLGGALATATLMAAGMNRAFEGANATLDKLVEPRRFNKMLSTISFSPGPEGRVGAHGELAQQLEDDEEGTVNRLRGAFKLVNKYAPTVAKDPHLSLEFSRRLMLDPYGTMNPEEYVRQVNELVRLESGIQGNRPSLYQGMNLAKPLLPSD